MSIKKRILASVAVASALWAGTTAYISGNTEQYLNNYVEKSNKLYANNGMKMSLLSFEKGFINSQAKVSLDFVDPEMKKELEKFLKLPIVMDYKIKNGPLLFKNGVSVGASRIDSTINISELLVEKDEFKKIVKEDIVLDTTMLIGFQNTIDYKAKSNQIVVENDQAKFTIAPLDVKGKMNGETLAGTVNMLTKSIHGEMGSEGKMKLDNVTLNADITKFFDNGFYLGDFDMGVEKLTIHNPNESQDIKNAKIKVVMSLTQNDSDLIDTNFGLDFDIGDTQLPPELNFLKTVAINYGLNGTRMNAWLAFQNTIKEVQKQQQTTLQKLSSVKTQEEQMQVFKELQESQKEIQNKMVMLLSDFLVKDKTTFKLDAKVNGGQTKALFNLKYIGDKQLPKTLEELTVKVQQELLNWIKLNVNIELDKALVNKLPQDVQSQLAMAIMTGMLQDNNSSYGFNATYEPNKLIINGQDKSSMIMLLKALQAQGL